MGAIKRTMGHRVPNSRFSPPPLFSNILIRKFDSPRLGLCRRVNQSIHGVDHTGSHARSSSSSSSCSSSIHTGLCMLVHARMHAVTAIGCVLASFRRIVIGQSDVTDISLASMPARAPSMLLNTKRVGPNTYIGVVLACDEAMAAPSSVTRPVSARCYFFWPLRAWTRSSQIRQINNAMLKLIEHDIGMYRRGSSWAQCP